MKEDFAALTALRKERHQEWHETNRAAIESAGLLFTDRGESLLFREPGKPKVDFYPSTGRWRVVGKKSRTFGGGAQAFIVWYSKHRSER